MATASFASLSRYIHSVCPAGPDAALLARFTRSADETAFAELVRRHGPAVLGVCRRLLRDGHAADDAFQATFLLLARKASSLRCPERLSCWLYGVACRTALKLRSQMLRRVTREQPFDETAFVPLEEPVTYEGPDLDAAIQQLPSKYRAPVVLCYLQGLTNAEAATALGCPANTVATRLARARERLRGRLAKQGLTVAVSATLVAATARNAAALVQGSAGPSTEIITLMEGVRTAMMWEKAKIIVAATIAVLTLTGFGATRVAFRAGADEPRATAPSTQLPAPAIADRVPTSPSRSDRIPPVNLNTAEEISKNFVVTGASAPVCEKISAAAEKHRKELALLWLGKELPVWKSRCPIRVTLAVQGETSSTVFQFESEFRIGEMKLQGTEEHILANLLPHEITHCILADHFREPIPRWVDEGAAILAESDAEQNRLDKSCRQFLNAGHAIRLRSLFELKDYPNDVMVMYAEGFSVTRFLIDRKDRAAVVSFVKAGMKGGWDTPAREYFGFASINELEQEWINSLRKSRPVPPAIDPPVAASQTANGPPPPSPAPPPTRPPSLQSEMQPPVLPDGSPRPIEPPLPANYIGPVPSPAAPPMRSMSGPNVVHAIINKEGLIVCKFAKMTYYEKVTTYRPDAARNAQAVTSYVRHSVQEERAYKPEQLRVVGADEKPIGEQELSKRLQKETLVLFVEDGLVDTRLLPLLKDGTLIITLNQRVPPPRVMSEPLPTVREQ